MDDVITGYDVIIYYRSQSHRMTSANPRPVLYYPPTNFSPPNSSNKNHSFLRLIALFFNQRVFASGFRLGLTLCVMSKYERLGFFFLMLSVAFWCRSRIYLRLKCSTISVWFFRDNLWWSDSHTLVWFRPVVQLNSTHHHPEKPSRQYFSFC